MIKCILCVELLSLVFDCRICISSFFFLKRITKMLKFGFKPSHVNS